MSGWNEFIVVVGAAMILTPLFDWIVRKSLPRLRERGLTALPTFGFVLSGASLVASSLSLDLVLALRAPPSSPIPTTQLNDVDRALSKLPRGSAVVAVPNSVKQYEGFDVALTLARKGLADLIDETQSRVPSDFVVRGVPDVRISSRMRAELIGEDFTIEQKDPQEQAVTLKEDTVWKWRVRGEWPGTRVLKVKLHAVITVKGNELPRTIEVAEERIAVRVNPSEWALRHWEWIATALVLPIVGWGLKKAIERGK